MSDNLSGDAISDGMAQAGVDECTVEVFGRLPSTNAYLMERAARNNRDGVVGDEAVLCAAHWQTGGRGRRGKQWSTDPGSITFSILVQLPARAEKLSGLSLVAGIVVATRLQQLTGVTPMLKWPNDVLLGDAKLCGLLTEVTAGADTGKTRVVTGIGINYNAVPAHDGYAVASLAEVTDSLPERNLIIGNIGADLICAYQQFIREGWAAFSTRWDKLDFLKGREISISSANDTRPARALGVTGQGGLLVESNGKREELFSGDVSVRFR